MIWALLNRIRGERLARKAVMRLGAEKNVEYHSYIKDQVGKTVTKLDKDSVHRYEWVIRVLEEVGVGRQEGVLCVGCRNAYELDAFERAGFTGVRGIDLVSIDRRILVMDMEEMEFGDNSFSVVYSGDSLEHAYNVERAAAEFCRVVKDAGYITIEMPANYETNQVDRWDVKNLAGLSALFKPHVEGLELIWQRVQEDRLKVIYRVKK